MDYKKLTEIPRHQDLSLSIDKEIRIQQAAKAHRSSDSLRSVSLEFKSKSSMYPWGSSLEQIHLLRTNDWEKALYKPVTNAADRDRQVTAIRKDK